MVSSLQARDLQKLLPNLVSEVLRWSSVSRNHFRSKVTVICEIIIRKCGPTAIKALTPEKYRNFLNNVLENRHKKNTKSTNDTDAKDIPPASSTVRSEKVNTLDSKIQKFDLSEHKRKWDKTFGSHFNNHSGETRIIAKHKNSFAAKLTRSGVNQPATGTCKARMGKRHLHSSKSKSTTSKSRTFSRRKRFKDPSRFEKRESNMQLTNMGKGLAVVSEPSAAALHKLSKHSKVARKRQRVE